MSIISERGSADDLESGVYATTVMFDIAVQDFTFDFNRSGSTHENETPPPRTSNTEIQFPTSYYSISKD